MTDLWQVDDTVVLVWADGHREDAEVRHVAKDGSLLLFTKDPANVRLTRIVTLEPCQGSPGFKEMGPGYTRPKGTRIDVFIREVSSG